MSTRTIPIVRIIFDSSDASKDLFIPKIVAERLYDEGTLAKCIIDGYYAGSYMPADRQVNGMTTLLAYIRSESVNELGRCR